MTRVDGCGERRVAKAGGEVPKATVLGSISRQESEP